MNSLESTTKIEHRVVHLPKEFEEYDNEVVRVMVSIESGDEKKARKERLFVALKNLAEVNPFADIEDPVEWQRKLRDEWE